MISEVITWPTLVVESLHQINLHFLHFCSNLPTTTIIQIKLVKANVSTSLHLG